MTAVVHTESLLPLHKNTPNSFEKSLNSLRIKYILLIIVKCFLKKYYCDYLSNPRANNEHLFLI